MAKEKKIRADFRKNRADRPRRKDVLKHLDPAELDEQALPRVERVSGKGELSRKRTVRVTSESADGELPAQLEVDESACRRGRVLSVRGLRSVVLGDDGQVYHCATRRVLMTLNTGLRHAVAAGDRVLFRPVENTNPKEGLIERIEPRHGTLSRSVRGQQQVIVANIDQLAIVVSADEPPLKPNLIDRLLVTAEKGRVRPLICINKIDLADLAELQPLIGTYSQMGYTVLPLSAKTGFGVERFARALAGRATVVAGQSGVGKSSLLNAIDPTWNLRVRPVSQDTLKGRHTTTNAQLLPLGCGGYVVDTPGVRQFELWDVVAAEVANFFRDIRPYICLCRFPDCTHTHEADCAVKNAVADGRLDARRYESYCRLLADEREEAED